MQQHPASVTGEETDPAGAVAGVGEPRLVPRPHLLSQLALGICTWSHGAAVDMVCGRCGQDGLLDAQDVGWDWEAEKVTILSVAP